MHDLCPCCRTKIYVGFVSINGYCPSCSRKLGVSAEGRLVMPEPQQLAATASETRPEAARQP